MFLPIKCPQRTIFLLLVHIKILRYFNLRSVVSLIVAHPKRRLMIPRKHPKQIICSCSVCQNLLQVYEKPFEIVIKAQKILYMSKMKRRRVLIH